MGYAICPVTARWFPKSRTCVIAYDIGKYHKYQKKSEKAIKAIKKVISGINRMRELNIGGEECWLI